MKYEIVKIHEGQVEGEETIILTVDELCERCRTKTEYIFELVNEGIINPEKPGSKDWTFAIDTLARVKKARRLQRDLELNMAGVALALDLLDRIEELENRLRKRGFSSF